MRSSKINSYGLKDQAAKFGHNLSRYIFMSGQEELEVFLFPIVCLKFFFLGQKELEVFCSDSYIKCFFYLVLGPKARGFISPLVICSFFFTAHSARARKLLISSRPGTTPSARSRND